MDSTCSPWCRKDSDSTERLSLSFSTVWNPFQTLKSFNVKCKRRAPQGSRGVVCGEPPSRLPSPRTPIPHPHGSRTQWLCSAGEPPPSPTLAIEDSDAPPESNRNPRSLPGGGWLDTARQRLWPQRFSLWPWPLRQSDPAPAPSQPVGAHFPHTGFLRISSCQFQTALLRSPDVTIPGLSSGAKPGFQ